VGSYYDRSHDLPPHPYVCGVALASQVARGEEGQVTGLVSAAWAAGSMVGAQLHGALVERRPRLLYGGLGLVLVAANRAMARLARSSPKCSTSAKPEVP
jgi:predicted MFS family arabinose efflux permease